MATPALERWLDANARFALDAKGTTNHCPMALVALAGMGATPARLQTFFEHWERDYAIIASEPGAAIERSAWPAQLGKRAAFPGLQRCFERWLAEAGAAQVIGAVLQRVPAAPGTGAFHAWIRLAYGLEAGHRGEIAAGLAALVVGNLAIAVALPQRPAAASVESGLEQLAQAFAGVFFSGASITSRLRAVAAALRFAETVPAPPAQADLLDALARTAIAAYWQTADFTILHMVTVTHAARRLFDCLPTAQRPALQADLWLAYCAAYVSVGAPALQPVVLPEAATLPDWAALCAAAVQSNDDHLIKLVYTCYCEAQREPLPLYRAVAARLVQREAARLAR